MRATKAQVGLRIFTDSAEPSLFDNAISTVPKSHVQAPIQVLELLFQNNFIACIHYLDHFMAYTIVQ